MLDPGYALCLKIYTFLLLYIKFGKRNIAKKGKKMIVVAEFKVLPPAIFLKTKRKHPTDFISILIINFNFVHFVCCFVYDNEEC